MFKAIDLYIAQVSSFFSISRYCNGNLNFLRLANIQLKCLW